MQPETDTDKAGHLPDIVPLTILLLAGHSGHPPFRGCPCPAGLSKQKNLDSGTFGKCPAWQSKISNTMDAILRQQKMTDRKNHLHQLPNLDPKIESFFYDMGRMAAAVGYTRICPLSRKDYPLERRAWLRGYDCCPLALIESYPKWTDDQYHRVASGDRAASD